MDKQQKLSHVVAKLQQLAKFIKPYLPLANVHNTNFIVSRHWNTMILEGIGQELLQLDDHHLSLLPSGELYCRESGDGLIDNFDCHMEDICARVNSAEATSAFSSKPDLMTPCCLSSECNADDINTVEEIETASCRLVNAGDEKRNPSAENTSVSNTLTVCHPSESDVKDHDVPEWDHLLVPDWQHQTLRQFIIAAVSCTLPELGLLTSVAELSHLLGLQSSYTQSHIVVNHAMKIKKSYEVDVMSNICAWIAKGFNISNVSSCATFTEQVSPVQCSSRFN